jgi:hypothetical protein
MTSPQTTPPPLNPALLAVTTAAVQELEPIWVLPKPEIGGALFDVLPALISKWAVASASVAADWYDELRETAQVQGRFTAIVSPLEDLGAEALAGWGDEALKDVVDLDQPRKLSPLDSARDRVEGGVQKRLVNAANLTVTDSADKDPHARGYMRRTRPGACKFCIMVASRGGVFTRSSSTFACHEHCYCEAVPAWGGQALPVGPYRPSDKPSNAKDRARVRKWIADNL